MDYILEFSSPEIKCCEDCRFYVNIHGDRYCTADESPLTDDPDLRMDWCPLRNKEDETALQEAKAKINGEVKAISENSSNDTSCGMNDDRCTGYYCVACPHGRFCTNEDEMFNRLVESTKYQIERWGLYWINIYFEEQDRVARNAFDRYREWLKDYGFTGREPSYKKYICYSSDTLEPCRDCGCHTGTFYFKPVAKEEAQMLNDLERKQQETCRGMLGHAIAEQAQMKVILQGLKKLFMQAGRADVTDCNQEHHPFEFEMTACDSLMKLYDLNSRNVWILLGEYDRVLKEDYAERAKEEKK